MSDTSSSPERIPGAKRRHTDQTTTADGDTVDTLLTLLNDPKARAILEEAADSRKSAAELSEDCGLSLSTTYRKVDALTQAGLLDEQLDVIPSGHQTSKYSLRLETLQLSFSDDELELETGYCE